MFGRHRAAQAQGQVVHQGVDAGLILGQEGLGGHVSGGLHVVVQVAVTQVAKAYNPAARYSLLQGDFGLRDERGHAGGGHSDVVLDHVAFHFLGHGNALSQSPHRAVLRVGVRQDGAAEQALLMGIVQQRFEVVCERGAGVAGVEQHGPGGQI